MKKIAILGHFAFSTNKVNGQTVKTKIIATELRRQYGADNVDLYDTMGGFKFLLRMPFVLFKILHNHRDVVILPAFKAIGFIVPSITLMNLFFRQRIHYVVIGGRLPIMIRRFPIIKPALKRLHCIYPETGLMAQELKEKGIHNVSVMPNCKHLRILHSTEIKKDHTQPFMLCTFSRVIKTKGIEDAISAVKACNKKLEKTMFHLDIYGMIEDKEWFTNLMNEQSEEEISYGGLVPFDKSTEVLSKYYAMLFPTYYPGECFAGTLIDALAAGLPVIASDWKSNAEIIEVGKTGFLHTTHSVDEMVERMIYISEHQEEIETMRLYCLKKAEQYQPDKVIKTLTDQLLIANT